MTVQLSKSEIAAMRNAELFTDSDAMYKFAPSLFATTAHPRMSEQYSFTNTYDILLHIHNKGFRVSSISGGDHQYKKVLVRMRSTHHNRSGGDAPEIVVIDSHDGSARLRMALGYIRGVCLNGMIAGDLFYHKAFTHRSPDLMAQVMLELDDMDTPIKQLTKRVDDMSAFKVGLADRIALADAAVKARWEGDRDASFVTDMRQQLLRTRRSDDRADDLYTVMNVIQENALRGGMTYMSNHNRLTTVRPVADIRKNVNINQSLWNTAEEIMSKALEAA